MTINKIIVLILLVIISNIATGQLMVEQGPSGSTRDGSLIVYGLTGAGNRLPYEKIKGSAFLWDEWKTATLFHSSGKSYGIYQVKLNLATHELHYKDAKGQELADDGSISKVIFEEPDQSGTKYITYVNDFLEINTNYNGTKKYAVNLNKGEIELLKVCSRTVAQADSLFGTLKRYFFTDKIDYYLKMNKRIEKLKRLNGDEIMQFIPGANEFQLWIRSNKLKMNREEDVVKFLQYVNNQLSSMR